MFISIDYIQVSGYGQDIETTLAVFDSISKVLKPTSESW